jgi:hypothetical protein
MFAILGLSPLEILIQLILGVVLLAIVVGVVAAIVLAVRAASGRKATPSLEQLKRDYLALSEPERRALLDFILADLGAP